MPRSIRGELTGSLLWSAAIALAVALVAALLLSRTIARPVEQITELTRRLGRRDFAATADLQVSSITEVNQLARTLSEVGGQLEASFHLLVEERLRLSGILQSMQDGVLAVNGAGEVLLANAAAVRLLDWPESPALPAPLDAMPVPTPLLQALSEARAGRAAEVHLQPRGKHDYLAVCLPVESAVGAGGAVAVLRDLENVMRLQRMRERFVADLAHELRGPLANLSLIAEAFEDGTIRWRDRQPFVQRLRGEVDRLYRLSRDVLDLARMDAGMISPQVEPVPLGPLCTSVAAQFQVRAARHGVTVAVDPGQEFVVSASRQHVEQILYNLLDNALRYTPEGGLIRVTAEPDGDRVALVISDTGSGIPAEDLPYVFDRFYKVDPARTSGQGGAGLGLAVVKQLTELQQGSIAVESEPGRGTTFRVSLPAISA